MRFIVPRRRTRVLSKESFMVSVSAEESRISSPMARVIYCGWCCQKLVGSRGGEQGRGGKGRAYVFEHLNLRAHPFKLDVVLAFQLREYGVGVLSPYLPQTPPSASSISHSPTPPPQKPQTHLEFGVAGLNPPFTPPLPLPLAPAPDPP